MIVDSDFSAKKMQQLASEMNLSETAFVIPMDTKLSIRYFTPTKEVPLCGHATLASAHILYEKGFVPQTENIIFEARENTLKIDLKNDWITMEFPKYTVEEIPVTKHISEVLGFTPKAMYSSQDDWKIAVATDQNSIKNAKPNFAIMEKAGLGHCIITAESDQQDVDFVCRCFAPMSGIDEDPVTGSAHCALTPLWADMLGKEELISHQISKRSGVLKVTSLTNTILIQGKAVTIFDALLAI